jgi:glyoxylase-like metal-dependent hydrolase (beta-lactamase superfamily II)
MFKRILKRTFIAVGLLLLVGLALLAYTFVPATLDVNTYKSGSDFQSSNAPSPASLPEVTLSLINCGKMISNQGFVFLGGNWSESYDSGMAAILIRHPKEMLLFDAGFGSNVDEHFKNIPGLMRALTTYDKETPAARQLQDRGIGADQISRIILSHSHWDHVSGAEDFPGVEVMVAKAEEGFIQTLPGSELIAQMKDKLNLRTFEFEDGAYENFDSSLDFFGDSTVVLVPLPGHTPGSTGLFVNLKSGKRFFFIGDLTWAIDGVRLPAERPWIARKLADVDEEEVRRSIVRVHELQQRYPNLVVVPAHDRRVHKQIAEFPESER